MSPGCQGRGTKQKNYWTVQRKELRKGHKIILNKKIVTSFFPGHLGHHWIYFTCAAVSARLEAFISQREFELLPKKSFYIPFGVRINNLVTFFCIFQSSFILKVQSPQREEIQKVNVGLRRLCGKKRDLASSWPTPEINPNIGNWSWTSRRRPTWTIDHSGAETQEESWVCSS